MQAGTVIATAKHKRIQQVGIFSQSKTIAVLSSRDIAKTKFDLFYLPFIDRIVSYNTSVEHKYFVLQPNFGRVTSCNTNVNSVLLFNTNII